MAAVDAHFNQIPQNCLNVRGSGGNFRNPSQDVFAAGDNHWLGRRAFGNWPSMAQFYTLLPPNSPSCATGWDWAVVSASSYHPGGVSVSLLDGAVRFVSDTIETRNLHRRTPRQSGMSDNPPATPRDENGVFSYGLWAELGAINSTHSVSLP